MLIHCGWILHLFSSEVNPPPLTQKCVTQCEGTRKVQCSDPHVPLCRRCTDRMVRRAWSSWWWDCPAVCGGFRRCVDTPVRTRQTWTPSPPGTQRLQNQPCVSKPHKNILCLILLDAPVRNSSTKLYAKLLTQFPYDLYISTLQTSDTSLSVLMKSHKSVIYIYICKKIYISIKIKRH